MPARTGQLIGEPSAITSAVFILAQSTRPIISSRVFTAGAALLVAVTSTVIQAAFWGTDPEDESTDIGAYIDTGLGVIVLVLGVPAIFGHETSEKDAARRTRMKGIASARPPRLPIIGTMAQVINFDALTAFAEKTAKRSGR